mmetsp:Transcript_10259/g.17670  ORF Transcript_10259/g.17670 Transcript_10259/m.17670 type:complete len:216 (+) Transcript_10259:902-1549(+)|eukprot:CAMPEP_0198212942 /NCGR_PEP_ID=MMETSP1445-20131203/28363_1 /TAXON_ID=36898 /ORGANISM="Pyramimonas sp., Strain CCMP2087" /LENGTH=215 /DNA_ID=CAMNT_0043887519 /DNA_START=888 /DNA_END=1535 /DNA_ORIENTATION=-
MSRQGVYASSRANIPDLRVVIERPRDDLVSCGVKAQAHDLCAMAKQSAQLGPSLHIPKLRGVVHGSGGDNRTLGVERKTHNLSRVSTQRVVELARIRIPQLAGLVEGPGDDLVAERVVESDGVHHVLMTLQGVDLVTGKGVPHFTGTVVRPCDESVPAFVERAVGEGEDMRTQNLEEGEVRVLVHLQLLDELEYKPPECRPTIFCNHRFLPHHLI